MQRTRTEWIRSAHAGDAEAVEHLCRAYEPELLVYVRRHMGSEARRWTEPEDIVQRALHETVSAIDGLEEPLQANLVKRMRRVARHRIQDVLRARRNDMGGSVLPEIGWNQADEAPSEGSVTRADTRRWLQGLVARLPESYRDVVQACALEGATYEEVARRLGGTPESVRKRYERARDILIRKLAAREHDERTRDGA